jgi:cell division protein ZapA (FtsZ GTPase activity inhibitor)
MGKGEPLHLSKNTGGVATVFLAMLVVQGCARNAPELPDLQEINNAPTPNAVSNHDALEVKCDQLDYHLAQLAEEADQLSNAIKADRGRNQVAGYLGGLFIVPLLAMKEHQEEKQRLDEIQVERDGIYAEKKQFRCP